jgi:hypothetical protein
MEIDDPAWALQRGVIAALKASPALAGFVGGRIYDEPPENAELPYIRLGNIDLSPLRMDGGTDHVVLFSVEAHSRPEMAGRVEATRIAGLIRKALDDPAPVVVPDHDLEWIFYLTQAVGRASDGITYTAVVAFRAALGGTSF